LDLVAVFADCWIDAHDPGVAHDDVQSG